MTSDEFNAARIDKTIEAASDLQIHLMIASLRQRLEPISYDPAEVVNNFPAAALGVGTKEVVAWSEQTEWAEARIGGADAMRLARLLLRTAWEVPALRPMADAAIRTPEDDRLSGGITLKVGTLATVLMLVASTSFDIRLPGVIVHKDALTPQMLAQIAKVIGEISWPAPIQGRAIPHRVQ